MTRIPAWGAEIARKNPQEIKKIEPSIENEANEDNAYRPGGAEIVRKNPSKKASMFISVVHSISGYYIQLV